MNVIVKIPTPSDVTKIAHSILAYHRETEELDLDLPIPLFLDTLALKIARVPPEDKFGALSYPLDVRAIDTFRFLLGLDVNLGRRSYYLESTVGNITSFGTDKVEALSLLTTNRSRLNYTRSNQPRVSERELVLPTLRLLETSKGKWVSTADLISRLTGLFGPSGQDAKILGNRNDTYFSQKVRNMISHRDQPSSFIYQGLATYIRRGLQLTEKGQVVTKALLS